MNSPSDELCKKWRSDVRTKFGLGPIGQATLAHANDLERLGIKLVAYLEKDTLNSATPEDFHREYAKTPELYSDWFPVYKFEPE